MSKPDKKKIPHDWRSFVNVTGSQTGPFSANEYCLALIKKQDYREKKGPPGAILYGEDENNFKVGFLKSEFAALEAALAETA